MDRVNEVVDYAIDNGMYVILNGYHDDYTWLNPSKADESKVKARIEQKSGNRLRHVLRTMMNIFFLKV